MRFSFIATFLSSFLFSMLFQISFAFSDITVGFIGPLTGPVASYGLQALNGTRVAIEEINKKGGIKGERLALKIYDDAADPKQGVSVANQLVGDGILYAIGPVTSNSAMPVSNILNENGVLMITPSATTSELSSRGFWNVFRTIGRDDQQADYAGKYVVEHFSDKNIAIVHDKATYGKGLADAFKTVLNKGGIKEVYYGSLNPGEKDYSALISRLRAEKVDYIYFGGYHPEAGLLLRQMREQNFPAILIGGESLNGSELVSIAGDATNGVLFTGPATKKDDPLVLQSLNVLADAKVPAETFSISAYAAIQVLAYGLDRVVDISDPESVAKILKTGVPIPTIIGTVSYGDRGDMVSKQFSLLKWEDGKIVLAE